MTEEFKSDNESPRVRNIDGVLRLRDITGKNHQPTRVPRYGVSVTAVTLTREQIKRVIEIQRCAGIELLGNDAILHEGVVHRILGKIGIGRR